MSKRLHFIDWLRVLAVLLLFPFHTGRVFNAGEPFYVKSSHLSEAVNAVLAFIDVWHMPLLFMLAGASTYLSLQRRSIRQYASERLLRLGLPFVFGFFVLIPPQTWYGARFNSGYQKSYAEYLFSGDFLVFNIKDGGDYYGGFGIGHLWFILFLLIVSMLALPLIAWWRSDRGRRGLARFAGVVSGPAGWLLSAFLILLGDALPDLAGINPFYYLAFFVLGFVAVSDEKFSRESRRWMWPALVLGVSLTVWWIASGWLRNPLPDPSLARTGLTYLGMLASWLMIVGLFGAGQRWLDRPSRALSYLAEASYPVYILHQTVIVVLAFYVVQMSLSGGTQARVILTISIAITFGLYEIVRHVGFIRPLFGMRPKRPVSST